MRGGTARRRRLEDNAASHRRQNPRRRTSALRDLLTDLQAKQARRNEASKAIGKAKAQKNEDEANALMAEVAGLKEAIQKGEEQERTLQAELRDALAGIPNLPAADTPEGKDEDDNVPVEARAF